MIGPQKIWSVFCYIEQRYLRNPVMKESNPIGQITQLTITTFATRLRLLLQLQYRLIRNKEEYCVFCFASIIL